MFGTQGAAAYLTDQRFEIIHAHSVIRKIVHHAFQEREMTQKITSDRCFGKYKNPDFSNVIRIFLDTPKNIHILPSGILTTPQTRTSIDVQYKWLFLKNKICVQNFSRLENLV